MWDRCAVRDIHMHIDGNEFRIMDTQTAMTVTMWDSVIAASK